MFKEIVIYDSSGLLNPNLFPKSRIIRFPNKQHGIKIDHFISNYLNTELCFLLDDDAFLLNENPLQHGIDWLTIGDTNAIISFKPRDWWKIKFEGQEYDPMGSYAIIFKKRAIVENGLSFVVKAREKTSGNRLGYYDTADFLNEQLIANGYTIQIAANELREMVPTFFGTSSGFMMLYKKKFLSRQFTMRSRQDCVNIILSDGYNFARAYAVANTIELHNKLFKEKSTFNTFFTKEELMALLNSVKDPAFLKQVDRQIERSRIVNEGILSM